MPTFNPILTAAEPTYDIIEPQPWAEMAMEELTQIVVDKTLHPELPIFNADTVVIPLSGTIQIEDYDVPNSSGYLALLSAVEQIKAQSQLNPGQRIQVIIPYQAGSQNEIECETYGIYLEGILEELGLQDSVEIKGKILNTQARSYLDGVIEVLQEGLKKDEKAIIITDLFDQPKAQKALGKRNNSIQAVSSIAMLLFRNPEALYDCLPSLADQTTDINIIFSRFYEEMRQLQNSHQFQLRIQQYLAGAIKGFFMADPNNAYAIAITLEVMKNHEALLKLIESKVKV